MTREVKIRLVGNALTVTIPSFIVDQLGLKKGDKLSVQIIGSQIIYQKL
jgi:antitoxin component of MazEF toxin-antitoxin module